MVPCLAKKVILLFHFDSTPVNRQDIIYSSSLAMHLNRLLNNQFFDHEMGVPGKQHNILQSNLYVLLTPDEIVAQYLLLAIVYIYFMLSIWCLDGNRHTLWKYN